MKINVYLPDGIGDKAKEAKLNLSGLLRLAVEDELSRLEAQNELLGESEDIELNDLLDDEGRYYTGRINGSLITGEGDCHVYISKHDETGPRIIVHDIDKQTIHYLDDTADLEHWLDQDEYIEAMHTLGETPVVNL